MGFHRENSQFVRDQVKGVLRGRSPTFRGDPAKCWEVAGKITARVLKPFHDRKDSSNLTGDWLIFAKYEGANYYLALAPHGERSDLLHQRILLCKYQFPFLT